MEFPVQRSAGDCCLLGWLFNINFVGPKNGSRIVSCMNYFNILAVPDGNCSCSYKDLKQALRRPKKGLIGLNMHDMVYWMATLLWGWGRGDEAFDLRRLCPPPPPRSRWSGGGEWRSLSMLRDSCVGGSEMVTSSLLDYREQHLVWHGGSVYFFAEVPLAWLHCSCSTAHRPVELARKLIITKPCDRPSAALCTYVLSRPSIVTDILQCKSER